MSKTVQDIWHIIGGECGNRDPRIVSEDQSFLDAAQKLYDAGYRLPPKLPLLTDEQIVSACGMLSINYRKVAQAQCDQDKKRIEGKE